MSEKRDSTKPDWYESPSGYVRTQQPALFRVRLHEALQSLAVSVDEAERWKQRGWIESDISQDKIIDAVGNPLLYEIEIVRDVVRSGLPDAQIEWMLAQLPRPVTYSSDRVSYNFRFGWVVASVPDPNDFIELHLDAWMEGLDQGRLQNLAEQVEQHLEIDEV